MTERTFRVILGGLLLVLLYFEQAALIYVFIGILVIEGFTSWRIPIVVTRLRYGQAYQQLTTGAERTYRFEFEAERALRIVLALFLTVSYAIFHEALWFFPWFIGFALIMAGITGICPLAILMRQVGFRG